MNILFVLIPISIVLLLVMIAAFVWAVRKGQFENLDAAAIDILSDDAPPPGLSGRQGHGPGARCRLTGSCWARPCSPA